MGLHVSVLRRLVVFNLMVGVVALARSATPPASFLEVDRTAQAAFAAQGIEGMGLTIYDARGVKRFEKMYGDFSPDRRVAIASASKLVAGLTILRLVDQGSLSLDSTTGQVLGWTGPQAAITLRQLLSFTSGLKAEAICTFLADMPLSECADRIAKSRLVAAPGTRFDYGGAHLQVAARMAEVATGQPWERVFATQLREPLGLSAEFAFYTRPRKGTGTTNPLIAGGAHATMNEYAKVLELEFHRGVYQGKRLIGDALFTAQATEPYPAAVIGSSPIKKVGLDYHYGLASWLECPPPAKDCGVLSSPGAFGFTPWVDRPGGYYAIIGMEASGPGRRGVVKASVDLAQRLKPLIRKAIATP